MPILTRGLLNSTALTNVALLSAGLMLVGAPAMAQGSNTLPTGGTVIGGSATISQSGNTLNIVQSTNNAAINWQSFSIGSAATTNFFQPGAGSVAVNRVTGVDPSLIEGHLNSNGTVVLVNPNGVLFGKGARVDVGGLVASTSGISEKNAIAGNLIFDQGSNAGAKIVNNGRITAKDGGLVALVSPNVVNNGVITAKLGKVSLAAGDKWTLDMYGDNLVSFDVTDKVKGSVTNAGKIKAGTIEITANEAKDVVGNAINMSGVIEASAAHEDGGTIVLDGGQGNVTVTGKLVADAGTTGNGGTIKVTSEGTTTFSGKASAKGGSVSGNGGKIETSGAVLKVDGATIDTLAKNGTSGTWLLDPFDLTINAATAAAIDSALATSSVTVQTTQNSATAPGSSLSVVPGTGNINVDSDISWSSGNSLTVSAYDSINVNANITNTGIGNIVLRADNAGSGAAVAGSVTIASGDLVSSNGSVSVYYHPADYNYGEVVQYNFLNQIQGAQGATAYELIDNAADLENYSLEMPSAQNAQSFLFIANNRENDEGSSLNWALGANITAAGSITPSVLYVSNIFDGNGGLGVNYIISDLSIIDPGVDFVALFSGAAHGTTIRNITLINPVVEGKDFVADLVATGGGTLSNNTVINGLVTGDANGSFIGGIGGFVGNSYNNYFSGTVLAGANSTYVGGYAGDAQGIYVANTVAAYVSAGSGSYGVGGFAGIQPISTVTGDVVSGTVIAGANSTYVGGYAGLGNTNNGPNVLWIDSSTSSADVIVGANSSNVGGFMGANFNGTNDPAYIINDTATGNVTVLGSATNVGGFIGENIDTVNTSPYPYGVSAAGLISDTVSGNVTVGDNSTAIGGFVGFNTDGGIVNGTSTGNVTAGNNAFYVGGGVGWNDAGGLVSSISVTSNVLVGNNSTAVGGLVGLNGSDPTNHRGSFDDASSQVVNSIYAGTVSAGTSSFAVGGLAGWDATWTATNGSVVGGLLSGLVGTGLVSSAANGGTTYIHDANQVGCEEVGGNCFGVAGQEVVTITPDNVSFVYGASQTLTSSSSYVAPGGTPNGLESGDASSVIQSSLSSNQINVGSSAITGSANVDPTNANALLDYKVVFTPTSTITVTPAPLTITPTGSQTYGGTNVNVSYSISGLVNGDASSVVSGYSYSTNANSASNVGLYNATAVGGAASNYNITDATGAYTVNPAALTVSASGSQVYGGTNVVGPNVTYTGLVNGDVGGNIVSGVNVSNPVTSSSNVGNYTLGVTGGTASNYTITDVNGNYTVTPASLTVSATGSQTYGGTNVVGPNVTYTGLVNGDTGAVVSGVNVSNPVTASSNAGTYTLGVTGGAASNYTITDVNGTYTVNQAQLTVSATGSQTYGGTNVVTTPVYTGLVNGDTGAVVSGVNITNTATPTSNVGTYALNVTGGTASNYAITDVNGTITVNPAALTVSANGSQTYGGTNVVGPNVTYTGLVNGDVGGNVVSGVNVSNPVTASSNAGTYTLGVTGGTASNYTITDVNGTYTVNQAALTVSANGSQTYGGTNVVGPNVTYTGLVNGDVGGNVVSGVNVSNPVTASSNAGTYTLGVTGGTASNYTITDVNGTYTVNQAALTVSATGSQTYGGTNVVGPNVTYTGLVNGDTGAAITGVNVSNPVTASSNAGTYTLGVTGGANSNYVITDVNGTFTVNQAPLTVGATGSQTYGGTNVSVTYSYSGLVNGDTSGVVSGVGYTTTATSSSNVGLYTIASTGGSASNYTITNAPPAAFNVTPASLTVDVNDTIRSQGSNTPPFSATFVGLVNGDSSSVVTGLTFAPGDTTNLGQGIYAGLITASGGTAQNYVLTYNAGTLIIGPAAITTPTTPDTNVLLQIAQNTTAEQQVNCLKINSEIRGITTDSPIDCSAPLQVNGF